jgi:hypothetical protein
MQPFEEPHWRKERKRGGGQRTREREEAHGF